MDVRITIPVKLTRAPSLFEARLGVVEKQIQLAFDCQSPCNFAGSFLQ